MMRAMRTKRRGNAPELTAGMAGLVAAGATRDD